MTEFCRTCGKTTKDTNARNIFLSENNIFIVHIELLTGECLEYDPTFPAFICICCEMDLRVAALFRERCIRMQTKFYQHSFRASKNRIESFQTQNISKEDTDMDNNQNGISYKDNDVESFQTQNFKKEDTDTINSQNGISYDDYDVDEEDIMLTSPTEEDIIYDEEEELNQENIISGNNCENNAEQFFPTTTPASTPPVRAAKTDSCSIPPVLPKRYRSWKNIDPEEAKRIKSMLRRRDCICDQCGIVIRDVSNFKLHQLRHTGIKNYECDICHGKFYTPHLLKRHKMGHSSVRLYPCHYCDKSFKYSGSRLAHERIHRNERPFKCEECNKAFRRREALKEHKYKHFFKPNFYCETCDKYFRHSRSLATHRKSKSHIQKEQGEIDELVNGD